MTLHGRLLQAAFALMAIALVACEGGSSPAATPSPAETPASSPVVSPAATPLARHENLRYDPVEVAIRLGRTSEPVQRQFPLVERSVGEVEEFRLLRLPNPPTSTEDPPQFDTATATLVHISDRAYFYVENGIDFDAEDFVRAGEQFDGDVYPTVTAVFGKELSPGVDSDPRITILHADLGPVGGYVSGSDSLPAPVNEMSNQREMLYIDGAIRPGSASYRYVLAHEFQHLVHQNQHPGDENWLDEGMAQLAACLPGCGAASYWQPFPSVAEETQLNIWEEDSDNASHYAAGGLFSLYLYERFGERAILDLLGQPSDGVQAVEDFLLARGESLGLGGLVADWAVANLAGLSGGPYGYSGLDMTVQTERELEHGDDATAEMPQFAANYLTVDLDSGDAVFTFDGDEAVALLPAEPVEGKAVWWSGRGDTIDAMLTREFDLSDVSKATLTFSTWHDIERWYDYAYVEVSGDGGETWDILRGRQTTGDDPVRAAYGPGYTGRSGGGRSPVWVEESIDLSAYAGKRILLRFEYLTYGALCLNGWALDEVCIREIDYCDGAESDAHSDGWQAHGFVRHGGPEPQRFALRVLEYALDGEINVRNVPLDAANRAEVALTGFGSRLEKAVVIVVAATQDTVQPARYQYSLR